jgi:hypothetical protein
VIVALPPTLPECIPAPVVGCAISAVGGALGAGLGGGLASAAGTVAGGIVQVFVGYLSASAAWLVGHIVAMFGLDPNPNLGAQWFSQNFATMRALGEAVVAPLLVAATIGAVLRQDLRRLGRIWGVGLPVAFLSTAAGVLLAKYALSLTDAMTNNVTNPAQLGAELSRLSFTPLGGGPPILVTALLCIVAIVGSVFVWLELVMRESAIYVVMFFMPLALATYVWPAAAPIAKRAAQILVALIMSKFVIFATISFGLSALSGAPTLDQQLAGAGILLLASCAPFALMKLAPIVEVAAIAHLEGMSRRPFRAAGRAATTVTSPGNPVVRGLLAARSRTRVPDTASPVFPQPLATRKPDYAIPDMQSTDG